uniref:Uncharacterized protein n=1 Tax=Chromera velia CCMP2878 TaxID=1169474 RepID=A0A0G4H925_9ALVE|eukprot:Cvel_5883.t1-p1 / transcript=Cvel_5883.t1 / gene=Cvel_5883 / organism=Chromera_velia_CCMP2878 / gene_product=hypothetical protein / transcript_product=hypothetical protein / location=Cvel_scaffold280:48718-50559(+) / protein_length=187 / sequence_SO=supercontig / SO=protein_coding / is_pseudo=false
MDWWTSVALGTAVGVGLATALESVFFVHSEMSEEKKEFEANPGVTPEDFEEEILREYSGCHGKKGTIDWCQVHSKEKKKRSRVAQTFKIISGVVSGRYLEGIRKRLASRMFRDFVKRTLRESAAWPIRLAIRIALPLPIISSILAGIGTKVAELGAAAAMKGASRMPYGKQGRVYCFDWQPDSAERG